MPNEISHQPAQTPQTPQAPSKTKKIFAALAVVALIATSFFYINKPTPTTPTQDAPPQFNLEFEGTKLGGILDDNISCRIPGYEFTQDRVSAFQAPALPDTQKHPLPAGVHLFHSDSEISVQDILRKIVPIAGNKVMLVTYNPLNNPDKKFSLYPPIQSPAVNSINDPQNYKIAANNGIAIISCQPTHIWQVKPETVAGSGLPGNIASTQHNWILASASSGLDLDAYEITSVWPQSKAGFNKDSFANPVDPNSALALRDYFMVWLKVEGPKVAVVPVQPDPPIVQGDNPPAADASVANTLQVATCTSTTFSRLNNPLKEGQFTIAPATLTQEGWNWNWNFGDNQTAQTKAATTYHAYAAAGTYNTTVTISKDGLERQLQCAPVNIASVQAPANEASCNGLRIQVKEDGLAIAPQILQRGHVYEIAANNFSDDPTARVNLRTNAAYGTFLNSPQEAPLQNRNPVAGFATKTLNPGQTTYFVVYNNAPASATTITGTTIGFANNCTKTLNIAAAPDPDPVILPQPEPIQPLQPLAPQAATNIVGDAIQALTPISLNPNIYIPNQTCNRIELNPHETGTPRNSIAANLFRGKVYEITTAPELADRQLTYSVPANYGTLSAIPVLNPIFTKPPQVANRPLTVSGDTKIYLVTYIDGPSPASELRVTTNGFTPECTDSVPIVISLP